MNCKCGRGFSLEKKQNSKRKRGGGLYLRPYGGRGLYLRPYSRGRGLSFVKKQKTKKTEQSIIIKK